MLGGMCYPPNGFLYLVSFHVETDPNQLFEYHRKERRYRNGGGMGAETDTENEERKTKHLSKPPSRIALGPGRYCSDGGGGGGRGDRGPFRRWGVVDRPVVHRVFRRLLPRRLAVSIALSTRLPRQGEQTGTKRTKKYRQTNRDTNRVTERHENHRIK